MGQVGKENRAKIDQKSIQKGIEKMMKKRGRLGGFWGGVPRARDGHGGPDPPLFSIFKEPNKPEPKHRAQTPKRTPRHAMRASAVADKVKGIAGSR